LPGSRPRRRRGRSVLQAADSVLAGPERRGTARPVRLWDRALGPAHSRRGAGIDPLAVVGLVPLPFRGWPDLFSIPVGRPVAGGRFPGHLLRSAPIVPPAGDRGRAVPRDVMAAALAAVPTALLLWPGQAG